MCSPVLAQSSQGIKLQHLVVGLQSTYQARSHTMAVTDRVSICSHSFSIHGFRALTESLMHVHEVHGNASSAAHSIAKPLLPM